MTASNIQSWWVRLVAVALLLTVTTTTWAATVVLNGANNAVSIQRLEIMGLFYDVDFEFVDGSATPITAFELGDVFAGNLAGADAAVTAIKDALNTGGALTVGTGRNSFVVPYQFGQSCLDFCAYRGLRVSGPWLNNGDADIDQAALVTFARFTVSTVPIPPALYLFGTGLGLLMVRARRKKGAV